MAPGTRVKAIRCALGGFAEGGLVLARSAVILEIHCFQLVVAHWSPATMQSSTPKTPLQNSPFAPKFRTDIQALRGFAVLIVLLYHADIGSLSAGFLGVDIFFVISGFLITSHVKESIERGTFSFADFYFRRAKRLLPAAYVTFFVTALLAPFFLASNEMDDFRAQMAGAVTFVANIVLCNQSGYFEGYAELKPLLHVWSLSIEEQYYFILPALMFFVPSRLWKRGAMLVLVASLALCLFMVHRDAADAFYLLPMRGWELAIGSLGALILPGKRLERLWRTAFWPSVALLLILPVVKISSLHPGPDALLICLATLVIILRKHPVLFRGPVMHGLGRLGDISYSLYLVHWPLFAFLNNCWLGPEDTAPPVAIRLGLLALSLFLAWLLNRYIEEPFRRIEIRQTRRTLVRTAAVSLTLLILPIGITHAVATDKDYAHLRRVNHGFGPDCEFKSDFEPIAACRNSDQPEILIWGDSYAMHLVPGILAAAGKEPKVIQATRSTCGALLGIAPTSQKYNRMWAEDCIAFNDSVVSYLAHAPSVTTVVLSSPFMPYLDRDYLDRNWQLVKKDSRDGSYRVGDVGLSEALAGLKKTVETVRALGKEIVVIAPPPQADFDIGRCLERVDNHLPVLGAENECQIRADSWRKSRKPALEFLSALPKQADVEVIHPGDFLCDSGLCKTHIDDTFIYRDDGHLSHAGSVLLADRMGWLAKIDGLAR